MCNCGCNTCDTKKSTLMLNESLAPRAILSEGLKHHIDNNKPLTEHLYRAGSREYFNLFAEARSLYSRGILEFTNEDDLALLTETNLGHFGLLERISTVSKRRAGAELKQKLKGVRSDGFGKYDATIYGLDSNGKRVELKSLNDLNKYNKFELAENKKVPLDFPIELNEQMDLEDELANMEFGMDYDQLGDNEKEWVHDEIDNMSMNEGTFNSSNHIAIFDGPDGMVDVYKTPEGYYFQTDDFDGEASNAKEAAKWLKDNGFVRLQAGSLDEAKKKKAKKKDNRPIGKPMRDTSGGKAYKVYVKDPKTKKIKTVRFGSGGLRAKINDSKARAAFAKRHKCSTKKDRTKAGYWSCRLPRYAKLLGLKSSFSGFW